MRSNLHMSTVRAAHSERDVISARQQLRACVAGGHNVLAGLLDFLLERHPGSRLIGFRNGPKGILTKSCMDITEANMVSLLWPLFIYRDQAAQRARAA